MIGSGKEEINMRLTKKGSAVLLVAFVSSILLCVGVLASSYEVKQKYNEKVAQMELYKEALNEAHASIEENTKYKAMYECMAVEKDQLQKELDEINKWKSLGQFVITFYWSGEDVYGKLTSTGAIAKEGKTIAVDPNVIPYGSIIRINGNEYIAQDCGAAIKGNKIDIFVDYPKQEKYQTEIYVKEK